MASRGARLLSYLMMFVFVGANALCLTTALLRQDGTGTQLLNLWALSATLFLVGNGLWAAYLRKIEPPSASVKSADANILYAQVAIITAVALFQSWFMQPAMTLHNGLVGDGMHYHAIYTYYQHGKFDPITPIFPFIQRIGIPLLAAHLPLEARSAFFLLHAIFWLATMLLFAFTCLRQFRLRPSTIIWAVLWLQVLWISIPRAAAANAFSIDSAALFFLQLWVCLLISRRAYPLLPLCALLGTWFKETTVLIAGLTIVALLLTPLKFHPAAGEPRWSFHAVDIRRIIWVAMALVIAMMVQHVAIAILPLPSNSLRDPGSGGLQTLAVWAIGRANEPMDLLRYLTCIITAYGGFALLALARTGIDKPRTLPFTAPLAWLTLLYLAICFSAGSDLTRFAYLGFPLLLPLLLLRFEAAPPGVAFCAWAFGLLAARPWSIIPFEFPPGQEDPNMDITGFYSWMLEYAHWGLVACWACYFIMVVAILRTCASTPKSPAASSL